MTRLGPLTLLSAMGALILLTGCPQRNPTMAPDAKFQLEGSAGQLFDLGYDEARILLVTEDVALLFVRTRPLETRLPDGGLAMNDMTGVTEDYPLKISYALWGDEIPVKKRVNLAEVDASDPKKPRVVATRDMLNDPRKTYPTIQIGSLIFNSLPEAGAKVTGDFNITFSNGIETASGRTVFGHFEAKVAQ